MQYLNTMGFQTVKEKQSISMFQKQNFEDRDANKINEAVRCTKSFHRTRSFTNSHPPKIKICNRLANVACCGESPAKYRLVTKGGGQKVDEKSRTPVLVARIGRGLYPAVNYCWLTMMMIKMSMM